MADPRFFLSRGPFTLAELATIAEARLAEDADPARRIRDVASLESADGEAISFLENRRYLAALTASRAGACLIHPALADRAPKGMALLLHDKPYRAYFNDARLRRIKAGGLRIHDHRVERDQRRGIARCRHRPHPHSSCAQCRSQSRHVETLRQLVVDIDQCDPKIVFQCRKFRRPQFLVDRHGLEIFFGHCLRHVHRSLDRMRADAIEPLRQFAARIAPGVLTDRWRNRIAVEYPKDDVNEFVENGTPVRADVRTPASRTQPAAPRGFQSSR